MNEATRSILLNKDMTNVDQDGLGKQGFRVMRHDGIEAWRKNLTGGRVAIAFLNRNSTGQSVTASWKDLEVDSKTGFMVYDVWKHESIGRSDKSLSSELKAHECQVFVLSPTAGK